MLLFIRRNPLQNRSALCCLAFSSPLFSFQGASEGYTLKIEQCKKIVPIFLRAACASLQDPLLRLLSKLGVALRAPQ